MQKAVQYLDRLQGQDHVAGYEGNDGEQSEAGLGHVGAT